MGIAAGAGWLEAAAEEAMTAPRPLTDRQREVMRHIQSFVDVIGYPPSVRELGALVGIASTNCVNDHLKALAAKGWIERVQGVARGLRILQRIEPEALS